MWSNRYGTVGPILSIESIFQEVFERLEWNVIMNTKVFVTVNVDVSHRLLVEIILEDSPAAFDNITCTSIDVG